MLTPPRLAATNPRLSAIRRAGSNWERSGTLYRDCYDFSAATPPPLIEEAAQRGVGRRLDVGVGQHGVHLPRHAVGVADPELVRLRVAARRPLLLEHVDVLALRALHLGRDLGRAGVADAEVAHGARLTPEVERQDDGRIGDLELRVVVLHLGRILSEQLRVPRDRGVEVLHIERDVKRVGHCVLLQVHRSSSVMPRRSWASPSAKSGAASHSRSRCLFRLGSSQSSYAVRLWRITAFFSNWMSPGRNSMSRYSAGSFAVASRSATTPSCSGDSRGTSGRSCARRTYHGMKNVFSPPPRTAHIGRLKWIGASICGSK